MPKNAPGFIKTLGLQCECIRLLKWDYFLKVNYLFEAEKKTSFTHIRDSNLNTILGFSVKQMLKCHFTSA